MKAFYPYQYPTTPKKRRHGPWGYKHHRYFQDWLEDEFSFRCVYCLKRMTWAPTDIWSADHVVPQSKAPGLALEYGNLVLACQKCNGRKQATSVPDPCEWPYANSLRVEDPSGEISHLDEIGEDLVRILKLNCDEYVAERRKNLRTLKALARIDPAYWKEMMGYPRNLPDLKRKNRKENTRREGISESFSELKNRGELPEQYEE